jgi:aarF domain-containing kinase
LRYTIYGKTGVFDAERFIDVMQAFENFISAAKSGGGEDMKGNMAELGAIGFQPSTGLVPSFPMATSQPENPVQARAALGFLLSDRGDFFREFILDEVSSHVTTVGKDLTSSHCTKCRKMYL